MTMRAHIALNAHLLSGEASYRAAGIHGYLFNTLAHLSEAGPDLMYTVFVGAAFLPSQARQALERSRLPTQNPLGRVLWEQFVAPLRLASLRPDLLHGMAFALPLFWGGLSVVTIYDMSFIRYPDRLSASRRLYLRVVTSIAARRARRIITISESSRVEIGHLLGAPASQIDVAVPGVSSHFHRATARDIAKFRRDRKLPERFILYVGTLEPRKNLDTLIRAYARLPQRRDVKLILAGGLGWGTDRLRALIEQLGLYDDVLMPGYVPYNELPLWYSASEIFVYPSLYEGFGLPPLEAMACRTPVIVSNGSSLPEVVGSDGVLVPPTEIDAWSDALAELLDNHESRDDWAARGELRAADFTWLRTAQQNVAAYYRALNLRS